MSSSVHLDILATVSIAAPCPMRWRDMSPVTAGDGAAEHGSDRVRHCSACGLHVYNIASLSPPEAEALVRRAAGERVCAMIWRRADGTVITSDCPVGRRRRLRRTRVAAARAALAVSAALASASLVLGRRSHEGVRLSATDPFRRVAAWLNPAPPPPPAPAPAPNATFTVGLVTIEYGGGGS